MLRAVLTVTTLSFDGSGNPHARAVFILPMRTVWLALGLILFAPATRAAVDLNGNGMSDLWELVYNAAGLATNVDTDGDGRSNFDESQAGTNPFDARSVFAYPSVSVLANNVILIWPTQIGKQYVVQSSTNLAGNSWTPLNGTFSGTGTNVAALYTVGPVPTLFRVVAQDIDTDGDGVTDWDELQAGFNPNQADSDGDGTNDLVAIQNALLTGNHVTVQATAPYASEEGPVAGTFQIKRTGGLGAITVQYSVGGNATAGTDYNTLPGAVTLPVGVNTTNLTVTPVVDALVEPNELVTLTVNSNASYTVGAPANANVLITDPTTPSGTGLQGQYYDNANSVYTNTANFTGLMFTRTDAVVDFDWGLGPPDPTMGSNNFSIVWSGQVQPEFTTTYTFALRSNDGGKLWVNGQLLIDKWQSQGTTEWTSTIDLVAGARYDIRLEYFKAGGTGIAQLFWYSPYHTKEIIPQARLYPTIAAASAITSVDTTYGLVGGPFSFQVTGSNLPQTFGATGLPPGLTINAATGLISGTPILAGTYPVTLQTVNAHGTGYNFLQLIVLAPGGNINREYWTGIGGTSLTSIPVTNAPTGTDTLASLQGPTNWGDNYGARIRGYLTAPVSGNYRFWIASDGPSEFWMSTDNEPVSAVRRATVTNATNAAQWNVEPGQRSAWLRLQAGQRYYIEILHKESTGADHVAVGWAKPGDGGNAPAEIVPGYVLSPYVAPAPTPGTETLYAATLTPQGMAVSTGSGIATLRVNQDETTATLVLSYGNLSSPFVAAHVHDAAHGGAIIFDLDDAPIVNGAYEWTFADTGGLTVADIRNAIHTGNAYVNVHTANYPGGEIKGTFKLAAGSQTFTPPAAPPALPGGPPTAQDAARFLAQTTFGASSNDIAQLQATGFDAWLNQQFATPASTHLSLVNAYFAANPTAMTNANPTRSAWWELAVNAPDQLRQRVAFALSEILVISQLDGDLTDEPWGLSNYYDLLATHAFGNFRQLLEDATLSPAMGDYLDMRRNDKPDLSIGRYPNENYAREVLQLFSIGLKKLHPDGTLKLDSTGLPVPTYLQDEVVGFAHTFTGWNYHSTNEDWNARVDYLQPMTPVSAHHDTGEKLLLDNVVLPAGQSISNDMQAALDNIFEHSNVGPFVCRQLIQRLVTDNPSPGYVYRVAQVFANNGSGVRGDLQAVVRAILLDYEARSTTFLASQGYGKQREPLLRVTTMARAFSGTSTNGYAMGSTDGNLAQSPLGSPTVFNFFEPDYIYPGEVAAAGLYAPEFQITSETTVINSHNFLRSGLYNSVGFKSTLYLDLAPQIALAGNPTALVDSLNNLLMAGQMSAGLKTLVVNYVTSISAGNTTERARSAVQLVVTSPEFSIQK